jgi:hypothetical protein
MLIDSVIIANYFQFLIKIYLEKLSHRIINYCTKKFLVKYELKRLLKCIGVKTCTPRTVRKRHFNNAAPSLLPLYIDILSCKDEVCYLYFEITEVKLMSLEKNWRILGQY